MSEMEERLCGLPQPWELVAEAECHAGPERFSMIDSDNFDPEDDELDALVEESASKPLPLQETMIPYRAHIGAMIFIGGRAVEVVMVRPRTIRDLDIDLYGHHLRGHEGSIGTIITYIESDHGSAGPTPDHGSAGPTPDHGSAGPTPDHGSAGPTPDHGSAGPTPDHGSAGPTSLGVPPSSLGVPPSSLGVPPSSLGVPPSSLGVPPSSLGVPPSSLGVPPSSLGVPPDQSGSV